MSTSEEAFSTAVDVGALSLVTDLTQDSSDVLLQLNALELLEQVTFYCIFENVLVSLHDARHFL